MARTAWRELGVWRRWRRVAGVGLVAAAGLALCSSRVPPLGGVVRDEAGRPLEGVLVAYEYAGSILLPTPHPSHLGVRRGAGIAVTDRAGRFAIDGAVLLLCPEMSLHLLCVYSDQQHSAFDRHRGHSDIVLSRLSPVPPNQVNSVAHADFADKDLEIVVSNFRQEPFRWLQSLERFERATVEGEVHADLSAADQRIAVEMLLREYRAFVQQHGDAVAEPSGVYVRWSDRTRQQSYEPYALGRIAELESRLAR